MCACFVNFTNHPSEMWTKRQVDAAAKYGELIDLPFPNVDADADEIYIRRLSDDYLYKILDMNPRAVLCQGEFTLVYQVVEGLIMQGITVLAACSERKVYEHDGVKEVVFEFTRFREYQSGERKL